MITGTPDMTTKIDRARLRDIVHHHRMLGIRYSIKGLNYERCAELPYILGILAPRFGERLTYLDIGAGESPLPSFILKHSNWEVYCVDKFSWVRRQMEFAERVCGKAEARRRLHLVEEDILRAELETAFFDVITSISVIEHFDGESDSEAMAESAKWLKPGGSYILTTLINEGFYRDFSVTGDVYGEAYSGRPVFYQRHHDLDSLERRVIAPSGLMEDHRTYFGDYGYRGFERLFQRWPRAIRGLYQWSMPLVAARFMSYSNQPISRSSMSMNTESGVIVKLTKPK